MNAITVIVIMHKTVKWSDASDNFIYKLEYELNI